MRKVILTLAVGLFIAGCSSTTNNVVMLDSLPAKKDDSYKETPKSIYQEELEKKLTSLLKTPVTPLKTPDIIVRVLFLPYVAEDGSLVGSHYSYVKIKEGNWILGDYLIEKPYSGSLEGGEGGIVKPLDRRDVGGVLNQVPSSQPQPQSTNTNLNVPVNLPNININPQEPPKEVE